MLQIKPKCASTQKISQISYPIEVSPEQREFTDSKPPRHIQKNKKKIVFTDKVLSPKKNNVMFPTKSLSGLRTIKNQVAKTLKKPDQPKVSNNSPSCIPNKYLTKRSILNTSISPPSFIQNSPKHESLLSLEKPKFSTFTIKSQPQLKHFKLTDQLDLNEKVLNGELKYKCRSCLENILEVDQFRFSQHCRKIQKSFEKCTNIVRDMVVRMKDLGKSNEGILLNKLWRHVVLDVDELIEGLGSAGQTPKRNLSDSEMTVRKVSIIEDDDSESVEDRAEEVELPKRVCRVKEMIERLTEAVGKEWRHTNRKYLDSMIFPLNGTHRA